ncbi:hypothetical protein As57867_003084, partial [Aphanomyces stellatus]
HPQCVDQETSTWAIRQHDPVILAPPPMGLTYSVQAIELKRSGELVLHPTYKAFLVDRCPDFAHVRCKITPSMQRAVNENWEAIANGTTFAMQRKGHASSPVVYFYDSFYTKLFEVAPEVRSLFRTSIIVQGKALINIIQSIIKGPITTDAVGGVVDLAYRHNKYGVKMQYYNILGRVLLLTLGECTGSEFWTSDLELAWRTVYAYMMTAMSPILYHGVTEPTELDKAMAKRGRFKRSRSIRRTSSVVQPKVSMDANEQWTPVGAGQCLVLKKQAWDVDEGCVSTVKES